MNDGNIYNWCRHKYLPCYLSNRLIYEKCTSKRKNKHTFTQWMWIINGTKSWNVNENGFLSCFFFFADHFSYLLYLSLFLHLLVSQIWQFKCLNYFTIFLRLMLAAHFSLSHCTHLSYHWINNTASKRKRKVVARYVCVVFFSTFYPCSISMLHVQVSHPLQNFSSSSFFPSLFLNILFYFILFIFCLCCRTYLISFIWVFFFVVVVAIFTLTFISLLCSALLLSHFLFSISFLSKSFFR